MFSKIFKPTIEFHATHLGIEQNMPIVKASECLPEWWEKADKNFASRKYNGVNYSRGNIKTCPGISDTILSGFILRAWSDIYVEPMEMNGCIRWEFSHVYTNLINHITPSIVYDSFLPKHALDEYKSIYKIQAPWLVKTKRGYSIQILNPFWFFNEFITCAPGIIDTDCFHHLTLMFMVKKSEPFIIPFGAPLAHIIPFKREKHSYKVLPLSPIVRNLFDKSTMVIGSKFSSAASYNRIRKMEKCPFS